MNGIEAVIIQFSEGQFLLSPIAKEKDKSILFVLN